MFNQQWYATQVRIARQTDQLEAIRRFYCDGLGLPIISTFQNHQGYDGLMLGLPNVAYHLEFIQHHEGSSGISPNEENLLVLYIPDHRIVAELVERLIAMGYQQVKSANPWWDEHGAITIEDPDRWRVVLQPGNGLLDR